MTKRKKHTNATMLRQDARRAWLFLIPWLIGVVAFYLYPVVETFLLSFTNSRLNGGDFIGLENYAELLQDKVFLKSLRVTMVYTFVGVPLKLVFALFLAVLLQKGSTFFRTAFYIPSLIGSSVAVAVMWRQLFGMNGVISAIATFFGLPAHNWIGYPPTALPTLIVLAVWQFGSTMVIFIAGLKNIPRHLYEAASLDGASSWQQFIHITLPMLTPTLQFNIINQLVGSFQVFTQGYIITEGGPMNNTMFSVLYIFQKGFTRSRIGYASAMSWVLFMLVSAIAVGIFWSSKYWVHFDNE